MDLKKCIVFTINKTLVFIDSMQLVYSSLNALVKNLSDHLLSSYHKKFGSNCLKQ